MRLLACADKVLLVERKAFHGQSSVGVDSLEHDAIIRVGVGQGGVAGERANYCFACRGIVLEQRSADGSTPYVQLTAGQRADHLWSTGEDRVAELDALLAKVPAVERHPPARIANS